MRSLFGILAHALPRAEDLHWIPVGVHIVLLHDFLACPEHALLDSLVVRRGLPLQEPLVLRHLLLSELLL